MYGVTSGIEAAAETAAKLEATLNVKKKPDASEVSLNSDSLPNHISTYLPLVGAYLGTKWLLGGGGDRVAHWCVTLEEDVVNMCPSQHITDLPNLCRSILT